MKILSFDDFDEAARVSVISANITDLIHKSNLNDKLDIDFNIPM